MADVVPKPSWKYIFLIFAWIAGGRSPRDDLACAERVTAFGFKTAASVLTECHHGCVVDHFVLVHDLM